MTTFPQLRRPPERSYSIASLRREFGVTARALRFYEEKGLVFPARQGMNRVYSHRDRARLAMVVRGRRVGISLAEIRDILDTYDREGEAEQNAKALQVFRKRIEALEAQRQDIDEAIDALRAASGRLADKLASTSGIAAQ